MIKCRYCKFWYPHENSVGTCGKLVVSIRKEGTSVQIYKDSVTPADLLAVTHKNFGCAYGDELHECPVCGHEAEETELDRIERCPNTGCRIRTFEVD